MPPIKNYSKDIYQAGLQNWDITQGREGKMYFANNGGLLIFDGANWELIPVENKTIVRSLLIDGSQIYVGSQGDFGYFQPNEKGNLTYHSLKKSIPKVHRNFSDVWDIFKKDKQIIFRTSNKIFSYADTLKVLDVKQDHSFLQQHNSYTFLQYLDTSRYKINDRQFNLIAHQPPFSNLDITGIAPVEQGFLVATIKNGIFRYQDSTFTSWKMNDNGVIKGHHINHMIRIDTDRIALATLSGGLFIVNNRGKVLYHFDVKNGLQSNDVSKIFKDGAGNLWLALGHGIDYIEISSPFSIIKPDKDLGGTGYAVKIHQAKIYFGVSNGLYMADWKSYHHPLKNSPFQLVKNTKGQIWNLDIHKNELLVGHHEGTFRVEKNQAIQLSKLPGTWDFIPLNRHENQLLAGNYNGLNLYEFKKNNWQFQATIDNMLHESCRILVQDNANNIWVAHPYRGVYRVTLDLNKQRVNSIKLYNSENGFPSDLYIHVFKIGDGVVFTAEHGIYQYNSKTDSFELSPKWAELIPPNSRVQYLREDKMGNIWFVIDYEVGVFKVKDLGVEKHLERQVFPQIKGQLVGGFEHIYPYDEENVFFPLERGFMHFNPKKRSITDTFFHVHLKEVKLGDSLTIFSGWPKQNRKKPRFYHHQNAFVFKYAASNYSNFSQVEFQYLLKGLDKNWSTWTTKNEKEYSALPAREYTFQVRARNALGQVTEIKSFEFKILPPWYASLTVKIISGLMALGLLIGLILIPRHQFEQEKAILKEEQAKTLQAKAEEYKQIVAKNKAEISELQKAKLRAELQLKNQKLATTTMHLVQKGELINKLRENLNSMLKETNEPKFKKSIKTTIQLLNQNANLEKDWAQFTHYFDQVHNNFLKRLSETYPQLTPKDQRMCTYLKMNLSSKEIMLLMNISVRGIESSRYRLRKKLGLDGQVNLNEFMMRF